MIVCSEYLMFIKIFNQMYVNLKRKVQPLICMYYLSTCK